jgi:trimethylamine--corrinoid protein Co-methyltransferase
MRHYETAYYQHTIFGMENYEKWAEQGAPTTYQRANAIWKRMLKEYEAPHLDQAIAEELNAFVDHRRAEIQARRPRSEWR